MSHLRESSPRSDADNVHCFQVSHLERIGFVVIGVLLLIGAFLLDDWAVELVRNEATGWGKWFAGRVSYWGDWYGVLAIGAAAWGWGKYRNKTEWQRLVVLMGVCAALTGLSSNIVRAATGRTRPFAEAAPGWYGIKEGARIGKKAHDFQSFPSAHTAVVAGFFAPLGLIALRSKRRRFFLSGILTAFSGTALMAWARVWNGKHHLSDVLASSLLGVVIGALVLGWDARKRSAQWTEK